MKPRLIILIACAAGMAIFLATRAAAPPKDPILNLFDGPRGIDDIREMQKEICKRPLPGEEPEIPPEFDVLVELDPAGDKNRLIFYITEIHGYYVETLDIEFYYRDSPDDSWDDARMLASMHLEDIIKANETLKGCAEVTDNELEPIGGEMGSTDNWSAVVVDHCRARAQNPDQLPLVDDFGKCR